MRPAAAATIFCRVCVPLRVSPPSARRVPWSLAMNSRYQFWIGHSNFHPVILDHTTHSFVRRPPVTTTSTIAEQVADYHRASAGQLPSEVAEAFTADQRALAAAGEPAGVAQPGTRRPDGELLDVAGQPTTLAQALSGEPAVIVFYRGRWCPYCNIALRTYQAQPVPALATRATVLA